MRGIEKQKKRPRIMRVTIPDDVCIHKSDVLLEYIAAHGIDLDGNPITMHFDGAARKYVVQQKEIDNGDKE